MRYLFVGLGNPGDKYLKTRHNAGFLAVDRLAEKYSVSMKKPFLGRYSVGKFLLGETEVFLVKPLTYMNRSGIVFPRLLKKYRIDKESVIVLCDNMDLPYGMCRIKKKGSHGGHNGLKSVIEGLGNSAFIRIFIGIGRPASKEKIVEYVLSPPSGEDFSRFMTGVDKACSAAELLVTKPLEEVMHEYNRKVKS